MHVCDYYCEVGVRERLTPTASTHKGAASEADASAQLFDASFEPSVHRRLPETDLKAAPFASEVAMFCFAHGCRLATREEAAANAIPAVTSFVLTAADKTRMYGACIVWYERLADEVVTAYLDERGAAHADEQRALLDEAEQAEHALVGGSPPHPSAARPALEAHAPEGICLLSRVPVFDALMEACRQLFRMRISSDGPIPAESLNALLSTAMPS